MANNQEYRKYTVYSTPDPSSPSADFDIHRYDRDYNLMKKAVESSLPKDAFYYMSPKQIDKNTGQMSMDIYVHADDSGVAGSSIGTQIGELRYKNSLNERYDVTGAQTLTKEEEKLLKKKERQSDNDEAKSATSGVFSKGTMMKIVALLTLIANITRRILSSMLSYSQQAVQDMVTAHNLGMSYDAVRSYRHVETTHGLKEGTITGAVADIQSKFGNITMLDQKALEALAVVMGGKIEEMATMGLGSSNPEKVLGAILDDFNAKANAGYNSVGQYVGEVQARRELYSYLLKVSPQIADIFATMQEEQHNINSIYRNQADTWEKWKNLVDTNWGDHTPAEQNVVVTMGQEWNNLKSTIDKLKEAITVSLAPVLTQIIRSLSNVRWGLSESENKALDDEHRQANQEAIDDFTKQLELLGDSEADRQRGLALKYFIKKLTKENKKDEKVADLVPTPDEIVVWGQKLAEEQLADEIKSGKVEYSQAMKETVDRYVPANELSAYRSKWEGKQTEKALEEAQENKDKQAERRFAEAYDRVTKSSDYQREVRAIPRTSAVGYDRTYEEKKALIQARYIYGAKADFRYDENGNEVPHYLQFARAVKAGYISSSGGITPSYTASSENMLKPLTEEEKERVLAEALSDEGFYTSAYDYFSAFGDSHNLYKHLYGAMADDMKARAQEGTALYDLGVLQKLLGRDLEGLSYLGAGTYNIKGTTTNENNVINHKIFLDINNNGKLDVGEQVLYDYNTNRESDTVNRIVLSVDESGKTSVMATPASEY